jgi:hypothetical protein
MRDQVSQEFLTYLQLGLLIVGVMCQHCPWKSVLLPR